MWNSCQYLSTRSPVPGVIRFPATTLRPAATAPQISSAVLLMPSTPLASVSSWTGFRGTSRRTSSHLPASMARLATSTRTGAAASSATGAPTFSTSAATRYATSSTPTHCTGQKSSTSTVCASTQWLPCCTWTTPAMKASGCRTSTVAVKTSMLFSSCRNSTPLYTSTTRASSPWPKNPLLGRV